jgi:hypothetical protein
MPLSLFTKKQPVGQPIEHRGGEAIIRAALAVRTRRRENLIGLSRSLEIPQDVLVNFANGQGNLNAEALSLIAAYLWHNASYDGERDLLVSLAKPPETFAPNGPPQWNQGQTMYPPVATNKVGGVHPDPKLSIGTNDITPKYAPKPGWA